MAKKKKLKLRPCFVLKEVKVSMKDLKKGDIFRLGPASSEDVFANEPTEYCLVLTDAVPTPPDGNYVVGCEALAFTRTVSHPLVNLRS